MPSSPSLRRELGFRPEKFSRRHAEVIRLLLAGRTRKEIAFATGYSLTHISRIRAMPQAINIIARMFTSQAIEIANAMTDALRQHGDTSVNNGSTCKTEDESTNC